VDNCLAVRHFFNLDVYYLVLTALFKSVIIRR